MAVSPRHPKDVRRIDAQHRPELGEDAEALVRKAREVALKLAHVAHAAEQSATFVFDGCASVVEWLVKKGADPTYARMIRGLGKAVAAAPEIEDMIRRGELDMSKVAIVGRVLENAALQRDGDDWIRAARFDSITELRRKVKARVESCAQAEAGIVELQIYVRAKTKEDFERARVLASRKMKKNLTDGEAITFIIGDFLDRHDPLRKTSRKRRVPDTNQRKHDRYVPAEVKREVEERSGGCCEFPGCTNTTFLQFAHLTPHREGSGREAKDFGHFCSSHHTAYDAGVIKLVSGDGNDPTFEVNGRVFRKGGPNGGIFKNGTSGRDPPERDDGASRVSDHTVTMNGIHVDRNLLIIKTLGPAPPRQREDVVDQLVVCCAEPRALP